jgi:hypothetical protein
MGLTTITKADLLKKVKTYRESVHENETKSCLISLDLLQVLIDYYLKPENLGTESKINGLRLYFFREDLDREYPTGDKIQKVENDNGQISIILVPTHHYTNITNTGAGFCHADDMFIENGKCQVYIPGGEHTGLCPKNCDGSL